MKKKLERIFSAIDEHLGDSDPIDDLTDKELREEFPLIWACSELRSLIDESPIPSPSPLADRLAEALRRAEGIIERDASLWDKANTLAAIEKVLAEYNASKGEGEKT